MGDAGAISHAQKPQPPHLGNPAATGRRGRRPLRASAKRKNQHHGKQMRHRRKLPPTPLGSPERGAVAARSAVTEGLAQRWCGETTLPINRRRAGVEARPYEAWGGGRDAITLSVDRRRGERGDGVDAWNRRRRSIDGGAPGTVRPTRRDVTVSNKSTSSVIQRKGRRGRRPLRWLRDAGFSGAVRYSLSHPLRCMPQGRFRTRP